MIVERCLPDPGVELAVMHPKTGAQMVLLPAPLVYFSERRLQELVRICNAPDIINMIREGGVPIGDRYTRRHATGFLKYAFEGWEDRTHFVFFLLGSPARPSRSDLAGCLELRSPDGDSYETGYWIAPEWRGVGARALEVLIQHARERSVRLVWARVLESNLASRRLLSKARFKLDGRFREPTARGVLLRYERKLSG